MQLVELYTYRVARVGNVYMEIPRSHIMWAMNALIKETFGREIKDNHFALGFKCDPWDVANTPAQGSEMVYLFQSDQKAYWGTSLHLDKSVRWQHPNEPKDDYANAHTTRRSVIAPIIEVA